MAEDANDDRSPVTNEIAASADVNLPCTLTIAATTGSRKSVDRGARRMTPTHHNESYERILAAANRRVNENASQGRVSTKSLRKIRVRGVVALNHNES
jgi:hypothetical protein